MHTLHHFLSEKWKLVSKVPLFPNYKIEPLVSFKFNTQN